MEQSQRQVNQSMADGSRKSININNVQVNLDDLDMKKLQSEQGKDLREIERLQHEVENLTLNLTMGNGPSNQSEINNIDNRYSMRPSGVENMPE